jgi:hypothetical protein
MLSQFYSWVPTVLSEGGKKSVILTEVWTKIRKIHLKALQLLHGGQERNKVGVMEFHDMDTTSRQHPFHNMGMM